MPDFEHRVTVDTPRSKVFDLFLRPSTAIRLTPPKLGAVLVSAPEVLTMGSEFEVKIQSFGQVLTMVHSIIMLESPRIFVERQVRGPFAAWEHEHEFRSLDENRTEIIDRITFKPPGGVIGLFVTRNKILDNLEEGYEYRQDQLVRLLKE